MKKALVLIGVLTAGMVALTAGPSEAWHHGRVFIGVGPYPYWGYPPAYYYGYRYGYPYGYAPPVVVEEPRVYIQQPAPSAVMEAPSSAGQAYWYYCQNAREYYPNVPTCSEAWLRVPARSR
jgi:hypothetical protein